MSSVDTPASISPRIDQMNISIFVVAYDLLIRKTCGLEVLEVVYHLVAYTVRLDVKSNGFEFRRWKGILIFKGLGYAFDGVSG
jgi:hypothetical protein